MKELSIEEKAKAYDDLLVKLQKAKVDNNVCDDRYCCVIDDIVHELKESVGEKVKTAIFGMVYDSDNELWSSYDVSKSDVLAWLEKQGEQKPTEWSKEDKDILFRTYK